MTMLLKLSTDLNDKLVYYGRVNQNCQILLLALVHILPKNVHIIARSFLQNFILKILFHLKIVLKNILRYEMLYNLLQINQIISSVIRYTVLAHLHKKYCTFSFILSPDVTVYTI